MFGKKAQFHKRHLVFTMKLFCLFSFLLLAFSSTLGAERVALVIGNNQYRELSERMQLKSPVADATDVAAALKSLGYTLVTGGAVTDASRESMTTATESFAAQAKNAEAAVFYYSGHGVQVGDDNYLLPTDTPKLTGISTLKNRAVLLRDSVMVALEEAGVKTKVIILDCCRDNPFHAQLETALAQVGKSIKTKSIGEITGYGSGFYLAFATSPGTSADDGNGQRNSPFTAAMLKTLPGSSGKDIDFLFREVKASLGEGQVSWTNHSLQGSFVLASPTKPNSVALPFSSWDIVIIAGREYVTAENIRDFYDPRYGFTTFRLQSGQFWLGSQRLILKAEIGSQEMLINNIKFILSYPVIEKNGKVLFSRFDLGKLIDPVLYPSHIKNAEDFDTVVIDAGHGGTDLGNHGVHGDEKDYTLKMAFVVCDALKERGFKVVMTRTTDTHITQSDRVKIANETPKSIFISLQFNSGSSETSGIETFVLTPPSAAADNKQDAASVMLAVAVHASVISRFKFVDRGMKRPQSSTLTGCGRPGILFEGGYITNDKECLLIASDTYRQQVSAAIADAVVNFRKALESAMKPAR